MWDCVSQQSFCLELVGSSEVVNKEVTPKTVTTIPNETIDIIDLLTDFFLKFINTLFIPLRKLSLVVSWDWKRFAPAGTFQEVIILGTEPVLLKCLKRPIGRLRLTWPFLLPAPGRRLHKDEQTFHNETQMVELLSCFCLS